MGNQTVDDEGNVYEQGWDGQYRQQYGVFGPQKATDAFGNPKVDSDLFGNPKQERTWWGGQRTSSSGRLLFQMGSGWSGSGEAGIVLVVIQLMFILLIGCFWLAWQVIRLCIRYPKVMLPIVGGALAIAVLVSVTNNGGSPGAGYTAGTPRDQAQVAIQLNP